MAAVPPQTDAQLGENRQPLLKSASDGWSQNCGLVQGSKETDHEQHKAVRTLLLVLVVSFTFMVIEFVGGGIAHSLAIITDAAHLLSDVCSFAISARASYLASHRTKSTHSFGYHRAEVIGALVSVLIIWQVTGMLVVEAVHRLIHPTPVNGKLMFCLAVGGCFMNLIMIFILRGAYAQGHGDYEHAEDRHENGNVKHRQNSNNGHCNGYNHQDGNDGESHSHQHEHSVTIVNIQSSGGHGHENMSVRAAFIHILGDMIQSIGVVVAGGLIWWHEDERIWYYADPICTFFFAALVLCTTRPIFASITDVFMESVPKEFTTESVAQELNGLQGIQDVKDLHIWSLKPGIPLLSAHILVDSDADGGAVIQRTTQYCEHIGIRHSTIQVDNLCNNAARLNSVVAGNDNSVFA